MKDLKLKKKIKKYNEDDRFVGIEPFEYKIWLSSPTMHGEEQDFVNDAIQSNWVSTVGDNIDAVEKLMAQKMGRKYSVALSSGTAALHLAVRLAGERLYGPTAPNRGVLAGHKVFCSDMTFDATVNPISYEGGECVFIDAGYDDWNMDPKALETAFSLYPDVKLIVLAHLYGTPCMHMDEIRRIADKHGALIVEDAAESLGASVFIYSGCVKPVESTKLSDNCCHNNEDGITAKEDAGYIADVKTVEQGKWVQTGCLGDYSIVSFNGNKIITGSSGGMFVTDSEADAYQVRKWSTQSREDAPWYQHEELGYNYRMSNIVAGIVRGQIPYLEEHILQKKEIWERYRTGLADLPVAMNPVDLRRVQPNYWLSCILVNKENMCSQLRSERQSLYMSEKGKSCPEEILAALKWANCEGRPIWKPMHLQPIYRGNVFITRKGIGNGKSSVYIREDKFLDTGADVFGRGVCLPSDNKMSKKEQDIVIDIIHRCFR